MSRVLVVEDDRDLREILKDALELSGWFVEEASDGLEALALLARGSAPDAIVLDLVMPRLDGPGFLAKLRADPRLVGIPVVVTTGTPPNDCRLLSAQAILQKPVGLARLLRVLGAVATGGPPVDG